MLLKTTNQSSRLLCCTTPNICDLLNNSFQYFFSNFIPFYLLSRELSL